MDTPALPQTEKPVSTGDWLVTFLIFCIPVVGFIIMLVWAFSDSVALSKRNYCRACLILAVVLFVLSILFFLVFGGLAMLTAAASSSGFQR